ncbi:MAG: hypothetical protein MJ088_04275 [Clostridia bacterium]|nr:hypothetical protein [Clostridia bacterium]
MEQKKPHEGHRARLRCRFETEGLDEFEPHNVLELLLFYAIPRRDTNEIAHRLLDRFGSLGGVFSADVKELQKVEGVGRATANFLRLVPAVAREAMLEELGAKPVTADTAGSYFFWYLRGAPKSSTAYLLIGKDGMIAGRGILTEGKRLRRPVTATLVEEAEAAGCSAVMLAHNHADGRLEPSVDDLDATEKIRFTLSEHGIGLLAHYIVTSETAREFMTGN